MFIYALNVGQLSGCPLKLPTCHIGKASYQLSFNFKQHFAQNRESRCCPPSLTSPQVQYEVLGRLTLPGWPHLVTRRHSNSDKSIQRVSFRGKLRQNMITANTREVAVIDSRVSNLHSHRHTLAHLRASHRASATISDLSSPTLTNELMRRALTNLSLSFVAKKSVLNPQPVFSNAYTPS